jgi:hypothetical protein
MKNLTKTILIAFIASSLFSCSKKMQAFQFGNNPATTNSSTNTDFKASASLEDDSKISMIENPAVIAAKTITSSKPNASETTISEVKPSYKQKLAQKIIAKKIQKLEKKGGMNDKMKLGLVIALVSLLVLIIVAAGLLGGLSNLFWLLGGLGLLAGLLIMLLVLLEVI